MFALLHCEYTRPREGAVHASNVLLAAVHGPLVRFDEDIAHANPIEVAAMHKFLLHRSQRARNSLGRMWGDVDMAEILAHHSDRDQRHFKTLILTNVDFQQARAPSQLAEIGRRLCATANGSACSATSRKASVD
ncbi:hypothetical protein ABIB58_001900 [Brevundimonas sp. UYEF29]|uniref:hypothetical protein n=1 Tax=Brevundimonas sp. UYEF29 TaxID=3156346 RepID=UPI003391AFA2